MIFQENKYGETMSIFDFDYIVELLKALSLDYRLEVFSQFCKYCGDYTGDEYCTCVKDD